jgi:branched-chain amino acid transport system permease protein
MTRIISHFRSDLIKMMIVFIFLATVPFWISRVGLYEYIALEILIWCIYAMGYNLALGYTGLPSFGHGAFFGIGAYAMAIYQVHFGGTSLWIGLLLAILAGILFGAFTGILTSHRRGIYFSLLTIAFGQMFWFLTIKLRGVTKGEDGLLDLQRLPIDFGFFSIDISTTNSLYYFSFVIFVVVVVLLWLLIHSNFGYIIRALKQNETRAQFLGYNVRFFKLISFTISCAISGLAGGLFALAQRSAFPDVMSLHWSGIIVMMVIIGGGMVSFWGPILGVIFYFVTRDIVGGMTEAWLMWFGLSFMAVIVFQPEGIAGLWDKLTLRFMSKKPVSVAQTQEAHHEPV